MLLGNGAYEAAKVVPLRNDISAREILHHVPFRLADIRTYMPFFALAGYREDIKQLLANPVQRMALVRAHAQRDPMQFLAFSNEDEHDLCVIPMSEPETCRDELTLLGGEVPESTRQALETLCRVASSKKQFPPPGKSEQELAGEWIEFLLDLSARVRLLLVIVPDHSIFQQRIYRTGATYVTGKILETVQSSDTIDLLDVRDLIVKQEDPECRYFGDERHLNERGMEALTGAVLPELRKFWALVHDGKSNAAD
jgi:hypothetical protein